MQATPKNTSLKLDYFFYSCFEFEQTCKAFPAKALGPQRWPETINFLDGDRENFRDLGGFKEQVKACLHWYCEQFPHLVSDRKLEMENIYGIASATAYFGLDLRILATNDSPNTAEALSASDSNAVWSEIDSVVDAVVNHLSHYVKSYLRWLCVKKDDKVWETGSRPPVGRFAPGAARRMASGRPSGDRPPRKSSGSGNRGGRPDRGGDRGPRGERSDRGDRDGRRRNNTPPPRNSHADQERAALDAVRQAVERLRNESNVQEVRLDPSNSFFRRLQHKKAVAEGFFSFSTGEGLSRAVVVTREKQEHEDAQ